MPLIDLIHAWKGNILPDIKNENKEAKLFAPQSSFQFTTPPQVIFVSHIKTRTEAVYYGDLPTIPLEPEEQKIYNETQEKLLKDQNNKDKKFHNGNQLLITGAVYDTSSNQLYLEAARVDYVFIRALQEMKAQKIEKGHLYNRDFFRTGVLAPFISKDDKIGIMTRNDPWKLESVTAGFLECDQGMSHPLSDLITTTALKEANEEFVLDHKGRKRLEFEALPMLASLSFCDFVGVKETPSIEFVTPIPLQEDADFMLSVMNNNEAKDASEHVLGSAKAISVAKDEREAASQFMNPRLRGGFLCGPALHAASILVNPDMTFASRISGISTSRFFPIGMFKPAPQKTLTDDSVSKAHDHSLKKD